jgi:hypothetical protein
VVLAVQGGSLILITITCIGLVEAVDLVGEMLVLLVVLAVLVGVAVGQLPL